jgi:pectate lyase
MVRELARRFRLGEVGQPAGAERALKLDSDAQDWRVLYALLELNRATSDRSFLPVACRIADNLLQLQAKSGLFPRRGRAYARTGDEIPLAVLHLAATLLGRKNVLPSPKFDGRFFHCEYDGPLAEYQKKRADKRTYDNNVFYGGS